MEKAKAEETDVKDAGQNNEAKSQANSKKETAKTRSAQSKGKSGSKEVKQTSSSQATQEKKKLPREQEIIEEFKAIRKNLLGI